MISKMLMRPAAGTLLTPVAVLPLPKTSLGAEGLTYSECGDGRVVLRDQGGAALGIFANGKLAEATIQFLSR